MKSLLLPRLGRRCARSLAPLAWLLPLIASAQSGHLDANADTYFTDEAGSLLVTVNMAYTGQTPGVLGTHFDLPAGWSFLSDDFVGTGLSPLTKPQIGDTVALEWAFLSPPTNSSFFMFAVNYQAGLAGTQIISGEFYLDDNPVGIPFSNNVSLAPQAPSIPEPGVVGLLIGGTGLGFAVWRRLRAGRKSPASLTPALP